MWMVAHPFLSDSSWKQLAKWVSELLSCSWAEALLPNAWNGILATDAALDNYLA